MPEFWHMQIVLCRLWKMQFCPLNLDRVEPEGMRRTSQWPTRIWCCLIARVSGLFAEPDMHLWSLYRLASLHPNKV